MAALSGIDAEIWITALPSVQLGAIEAATDSGDHINYNMSVHKYWDTAHTVVLEQSANGTTGWTTIPAVQYRFNYCGGLIVFTTARVVATNNFVRLTTSGFFLNAALLTDCMEWNLDMGGDTVDTTPFEASGNWRVHTATVKKATAKINGYRVDDTFAAILTNPMILILYANKPGNIRWECYALVTAVAPKTSVTGVITQEASFQATSDVYFYIA